MSKKPLGLRERNRIRTRDEILAAMSVLLGENPFESITIDDVAQRAGVSRGTIYTYFPDGRDQLVRDAYTRIADALTADAIARREQHEGFTDRVVALATAFSDIVSTPEGRFYGIMGPGTLGPVSSVAGTGSRTFAIMLTEDLERAKAADLLAPDAPAPEIAVLLAGALREIGATVARDPERAAQLLRALRIAADAMLAPRS